MNRRIYLSPPTIEGDEVERVVQAIRSGWIAPLGPNVDAFEAAFAARVGAAHAVALSSGTAALHLSLILAGVQREDEVIVSTFTFSASVNPIVYLGARPVFIDSEVTSWNMDPELLEQALAERARAGRLPRAVVLVHLYGQSANLHAIQEICARHDVTLIEDAAEALGATYDGKSPGTFGRAGVFSFNGNKIITSSGGGMLVTADRELAMHARKLATQARDPAPHYQHSEIGYNYRMSNVLAALGAAQLEQLDARVAARRQVFEHYRSALAGEPGITFMPEASWGTHTRWLTCITIDPKRFGCDHETIRLALEAVDIESRPLWKPMHMQPVFDMYPVLESGVARNLFEHGLCLPSGTGLSVEDVQTVAARILAVRDSALGQAGSRAHAAAADQ